MVLAAGISHIRFKVSDYLRFISLSGVGFFEYNAKNLFMKLKDFLSLSIHGDQVLFRTNFFDRQTEGLFLNILSSIQILIVHGYLLLAVRGAFNKIINRETIDSLKIEICYLVVNPREHVFQKGIKPF